jgi:hypothetical protein
MPIPKFAAPQILKSRKEMARQVISPRTSILLSGFFINSFYLLEDLSKTCKQTNKKENDYKYRFCIKPFINKKSNN